MGFSWPQLVVVSGLFGGNPLMDGILAILEPFSRTSSFFTLELWLSRSLFHELFLLFTMEFRLSRSHSHELFFFHDGISAITKPFSRTFLFSRWNSGYHGAFLTNFFFFQDGTLAITKPFSRTFSFFKMELWLSRSLSHELFLFSGWNSGYHEAFLTNFFFF
jgi:hypothetical protein